MPIPEEDGGAMLYRPVTTMPVELDVVSYDILNRLKLKPRNIHHQLEIPASLSSEDRLVTSVRELWEDERKRRIARGLNPTPHLPAFDSDERGAGGDWKLKGRFQAAIQARIEEEREMDPPVSMPKAWETWVMTAFESVQALWQRPHKTWQPSNGTDNFSDAENPFEQSNVLAEEDIKAEVDETILSSQTFDFEIQGLDEDDQWQRWHEEQEAPSVNPDE